MSEPAPLRIEDHLPPWHKQPDESNRDYAAFAQYLDLPPSLRLSEGFERVAEAKGRRTGSVARIATRNRWGERATAHDQHYEQVSAYQDKETSRAAYERTVGVLDTMTGILEEALQGVEPSEFTPSMLIRYADTVLRWRAATYGQATERVAVSGSIDQQITATLDVRVQRWADMPQQDRDAEIQRLADDVQRKRTILASEATATTTEDDPPALPAASEPARAEQEVRTDSAPGSTP